MNCPRCNLPATPTSIGFWCDACNKSVPRAAKADPVPIALLEPAVVRQAAEPKPTAKPEPKRPGPKPKSKPQVLAPEPPQAQTEALPEPQVLAELEAPTEPPEEEASPLEAPTTPQPTIEALPIAPEPPQPPAPMPRRKATSTITAPLAPAEPKQKRSYTKRQPKAAPPPVEPPTEETDLAPVVEEPTPAPTPESQDEPTAEATPSLEEEIKRCEAEMEGIAKQVGQGNLSGRTRWQDLAEKRRALLDVQLESTSREEAPPTPEPSATTAPETPALETAPEPEPKPEPEKVEDETRPEQDDGATWHVQVGDGEPLLSFKMAPGGSIVLTVDEASDKMATLLAEDAVTALLHFIGEDPNRDGLQGTPERVVRAWAERTRGIHMDPAKILGRVFDEEYSGPVLLKEIEFHSTCEHHLLGFVGTVTIAYLPGKVVGISKLARLVECFSQRLQIQERMTNQIADAIMKHLEARGVAVVVKAHHSCMSCRGVMQSNTEMVTTSFQGEMDCAEAQAQFWNMTR